MKFIKRGLAILMTILLIMPVTPVRAVETDTTQVTDASTPDENVTDDKTDADDTGKTNADDTGKTDVDDADKTDADDTDKTDADDADKADDDDDGNEADTGDENGTDDDTEDKTEDDNVIPVSTDRVQFNTGNHVYTVAGEAAAEDESVDDFFEENGSYTINIPEANPFFPYEVQFTYDGEVTNHWFMTPDNSVEIGSHTFYVSAYFDGTIVTQLSLNVAGDTVVVYPEDKEFTNDGDGAAVLSLLPLKERHLNVDLRGYTPVELTMVSVASIFTGSNAMQNTDKLVWRQNIYSDDDDYTVSQSGDTINLSYNTYYSNSKTLEMIVGDGDQLNTDNIRYIVNAQITKSEDWLTSKAYIQDGDGNRVEVTALNSSRYTSYQDYSENRQLNIYLSSSELGAERQVYLGLNINRNGTPRYDHYKVYEGKFMTASEAETGTDITDKLFNEDMTQTGKGYLIEMYNYKWITMVTFDRSGNVTGCLPFRIYMGSSGSSISSGSLFKRTDNSRDYVSTIRSNRYEDGWTYYTYKLYEGYAANDSYCYTLEYIDEAGNSNSAAVTGAFLGRYFTIEEAKAAGADDVKDSLFNNDYNTGGYEADYSKGVYFSIFIGEDGSDQKRYCYCIKTEESDIPLDNYLSSATHVTFTGLADASHNEISSHYVKSKDSYSECNYLTIFVDNGTDLTNVAPEFTMSYGMKLYAEGKKKPEESGESCHDFSNGPVQYTASAEDGSNSKNYWLQIVAAENGEGKIYINSFADKDADTRVENGVIYSKREVMLTQWHDNIHDILIANIGTTAIPNMSVVLDSNTVELDQYWTLSGTKELSAFSLDSTQIGSTINAQYGELPNLAKIRIKAKEDADSDDVTGTLTIKSGNTTLVVLELTGTIGDPHIITENIPEAVKYVPYGTMIQNNNKYDWNKVSYSLYYGNLPGGMEIKPNGELYGVPTETGSFYFGVRMHNSYNAFRDDTKYFTLEVIENTDANVDGATDTDYELTQRIQPVSVGSGTNQTMVSEGGFQEFVDLYLDGVKLAKGIDYEAELGSTRITIIGQTLSNVGVGTHTLGIEFRDKDEALKRAAQNYTVKTTTPPSTPSTPGNNSGNGNTGSSGNNSGSSNAGNSVGGNSGSDGTVNSSNGINSSTVGSNALGSIISSDTGYISIAGGNNAIAASESYTIQPGDTLWKIAEKFYGSGSYWKKIYEDNSAIISDPDKIYVGQTITIYADVSDTIITIAADGTRVTTYTVKSGDTLWKIAKELYGKGRKWRYIFNANSDIISDPGRIYAGQVIVIPD